MLPTSTYTYVIPANGSVKVQIKGNLFKIMAATGAVSVQSAAFTLKGLLFGQGLMDTPFDDLLLTDASGASNTVKILIGDKGFIDAQTGNFSVLSNKAPQSSAFVNVNATVTNASAQLIAANVNRQYLLIQNKDPSGSIYINFGAAATVANGIQISPGGAYELAGTVSTQQINAIGSIANNANIVTVEG